MTFYDVQAGRVLRSEPEPNGEQSESDEHLLAAGVLGLASLMSDVEDIEAVLAQIAGFAVASVRHADGAGVTVARPTDRPTVLAWAVTDPFVRQIDHLQYDVCGEGPCISAMQTGRPLVSGSLGSDTRWPRFGGRVARLGVHSALSVPLLIRDSVVGALNIYAHGRDAFTERSVQLGTQFAVPAAVSVRHVQTLHAARSQAAQLGTALRSRAVIDQAIGILRSRSGGTAEQALDRLRQISQTENVKVAVLAQRLVDDAVRRAQVRLDHPAR